jgi:hypothetical protein
VEGMQLLDSVKRWERNLVFPFIVQNVSQFENVSGDLDFNVKEK